jgi:RND family efflux transporter MFP subunit
MKKAVLLFAVFTVFITSCSSDKETNVGQGKFKVTKPIVHDTYYTVDYVAEIRSVSFVELRARVKGYIEKINTDEGKDVKKGQLLFQISNEDYKEQLLKARAALKTLQAELKAQQLELTNLQSLVNKKVIAKTEYEIAQTKEDALKARIEEAEADITGAEINLSRTEIKSPFDGVIDMIPNKEGSLIEEGALLSSVTSNEEIYTYFNVSEKEYLDYFSKIQISNKEKVSLVLANNTIHEWQGVIETVNGKIDRSTGSLTMRAHFKNPSKTVKHGASGKVRIYLPLKNALLIPQKSTMEIQDKYYVYVVTKDNLVQLKAFVPKFRLTDFYVVESGLDPSDLIIYEGIQLLKEGDKVTTEVITVKQTQNQTL